MAILRPGLHFHNASGITPADVDIVRRWSPLSLLEAMDGVVNDQMPLLRDCWEAAGRPPLVLRRYYEPRRGGPNTWGAHAMESVILAKKCVAAGIPVEKLILKPFNEPNMPVWANWEGFGDKEADIVRYNEALLLFIGIAKRELPGIRIGGPHLTVGNRDVRFPSDPVGVYYYHGATGLFKASRCSDALEALDVHFVHTYGMQPGQYADRAHGLRFLEYEKYLKGKDIYIVEGAYGISSGQAADQNTVRAQETAAYLRLLGEKYPQVKGIALWIGGDPGVGWFAFCHSNGPNPESHRPVVYAVEAACHEGEPDPEPPKPPAPPEPSGYVDFDGLSDRMVLMVRVLPTSNEDAPHWKVERIEVQPEADHQSMFAVLPVGSKAIVQFSWAGGQETASAKADALAPMGAREWAASMPMFEPWGAYSVAVVGNSEKVTGLGLYADDLNVDYKGHHPVVVKFRRAEGVEPEPPAPPPPVPPPLPPPPPPPDPGEDVYKLMKAFPRAGIAHVVDLRDEIESFSDMVALRKRWRLFDVIRLAVVHHSGSDFKGQSPLSIARYRVEEKGDPTIPYHFCVDFDGRLSFTARLCYSLPNSGKSVANEESVSVCVLGDYRKNQMRPTLAQLDTLRRLIWHVLPEFLGGDWGRYRGFYVIPHGRLVATECPGENLVRSLVWLGMWPELGFFRRKPAGDRLL